MSIVATADAVSEFAADESDYQTQYANMSMGGTLYPLEQTQPTDRPLYPAYRLRRETGEAAAVTGEAAAATITGEGDAGIMSFFNTAAAGVGAAMSGLTRRLSLPTYEETADEMAMRSAFEERRPPASPVDEPRAPEFDPYAEAHARGLHPSQYSDDDEPSDENNDESSLELCSSPEQSPEAPALEAPAAAAPDKLCGNCDGGRRWLIGHGFTFDDGEPFQQISDGLWSCKRPKCLKNNRTRLKRLARNAELATLSSASATRRADENDCDTCRNAMKHCFCSYCDAEAPIDGLRFGLRLSYRVGEGDSSWRIGMYVGSIKAGSPYPASSDPSWRSTPPTRPPTTHALVDGVFLVDSFNIHNFYAKSKPIFVPNTHVALLAEIARQERERSGPEKFDPKWDEPNATRVAASLRMWRRLKYPSQVVRGGGRLRRDAWPAGFRDLVFQARASEDGATRCFCCARKLGANQENCMRHNLIQTDPAEYIDLMELSHVEAHSLGGPDIYVNVWPGCTVCNGIMRANRFTDFAVGKWTLGQEPKDGRDHPVQTPNAITQSPEYLRAKKQFDEWYMQWDNNGRPGLKPDPNGMMRNVRKWD
jgi:hypothetical protein